jgi:hypothetical protein
MKDFDPDNDLTAIDKFEIKQVEDLRAIIAILTTERDEARANFSLATVAKAQLEARLQWTSAAVCKQALTEAEGIARQPPSTNSARVACRSIADSIAALAARYAARYQQKEGE